MSQPTYDCQTCKQKPPREAYRCLRCGKVPDVHPFPTIGCECIRVAWLCDPPCFEIPEATDAAFGRV